VEDFDECIRLRPDSALAQAQKCFALVGDMLVFSWVLFLFKEFWKTYCVSLFYSNLTEKQGNKHLNIF